MKDNSKTEAGIKRFVDFLNEIGLPAGQTLVRIRDAARKNEEVTLTGDEAQKLVEFIKVLAKR